MFSQTFLYEFLEEKYRQYHRDFFIESDPICTPHCFTIKEDIEIAGFLTATISWGNRKAIINSANQLMRYMENNPFDFVMEYDAAAANRLRKQHFVYRTFNAEDLHYFILGLKHAYTKLGGLEQMFTKNIDSTTVSIKQALASFVSDFSAFKPPMRSAKHLAKTDENSAAKRLNMFLRWMVRKDNFGVDFGLWSGIKSSQLSIPLDVHSGSVARKLGLLERKQNDWKAVEELDEALRALDPHDPVKYDYALFGLGVFEKFCQEDSL